MAGAGFAKGHGKVAATEAESLNQATGYSDASVAARNSETAAVNPKASGAVVNFERALAHDGECVHDASGDGDLAVMESAWIAIDSVNSLAGRARREQQSRPNQQAGKADSLVEGSSW